MLLARIEWLRFARRERLANRRLIAIHVIVAVVGRIATLLATLLIIGLALAKLLLGCGNQAEIMLGVLIIILGGDGIARTLRVPRQLEIFFRNMGGCSSNLHVRSVGLVHARQWILVMTTLAVAPAHSLILS